MLVSLHTASNLSRAYAIDASKKNKTDRIRYAKKTKLPRVRVEVAHVVEHDRGKNVDHAERVLHR